MEMCSEYLVQKSFVRKYYLKRSIANTDLNFTKINFFGDVFKLFYQHYSGKLCVPPE